MTRFQTYISNLQRFGIQPGLERIQALLERAGNPHQKFPHLLVGGTNGKGSTSEFAARILAQNGRKIGLYTSPHLYNWNERLRILPGEGLFEGAISNDELDELFGFALPFIESVAQNLGQPTEFEVVTFLGLLHFARQNVDAAVLEVGLGGKWDATNATKPLVSCVTHVALDHMDRLGNTLEEIAADKVCIARSGRPFVTGETKPNVRATLEDYCAQIGAPFFYRQPPFVNPRDYQQINFDLAQEITRHFCEQCGWETPETAPFELQVRGRFEQIAPNFYIDGANNPEGAAVLVDFLDHTRGIGEIILVLGILADKNWPLMTATLAPQARVVICTQSDSPRALAASQLAEEARKHNPNIEIVPDVAAAVARAKTLRAPGETILVTGSFTTIAEVPRD